MFFLFIIGKKSLCLYLNPQHFSPYFFSEREIPLPLSEDRYCSSSTVLQCPMQPQMFIAHILQGWGILQTAHSQLWSHRAPLGEERLFTWAGKITWTSHHKFLPWYWKESINQSSPWSLFAGHCNCNSIMGQFHGRSSLLHRLLFLEATTPVPHRKRIFFPSLGEWGKLGCQGRTETPYCRAQPCTKGSPAWMPTQENSTLPPSLSPTSPEVWTSQGTPFSAWTSEIWDCKDSWDLLKDLSGKHPEWIGQERVWVRDRWVGKEKKKSWIEEHLFKILTMKK